ncbi:amyloid-beta precursor-like protein [Aplysia californica]|uniref:Amyloid-beta precursor-like protein n=1 Tax=Aplysia californica TaxID=6500 RepID=A0ABM1AD11_APLCA|nr:amyloid-beta precursor-like protein [Aplysia californica]
MLSRYPDIEVQVRPEVEEFMKRFDAIANSIKNVVLPLPKVEEEPQTKSASQEAPQDASDSVSPDDDIRIDDAGDFDLSSEQVDEEGDDVSEDEHDYERGSQFIAHRMDDKMHVRQGFAESAATSSQMGSTIGIALGGVSVFVIIVVAVFMVKRKNRNQYPSPGYVEVDPSASPEERHVANMQMNGYENPTYKYFEVQSNPNA